MRPLNLASRPFRNERLGEALFAAGATALLALTAWHAVVIRDLLPARTSGLHTEVAALDTELAALRKEAAGRRTEAPPSSVLAQWALVKELVDRRTFSWAGLFASLEGVIPDDVRLTSISPSVHKGQVEVDVTATVREPSAGWEFVRALQSGGEFYDVFPTSETDREFRYKFRYRPQEPAEPVGPPAPPPDTSTSADGEGQAPSVAGAPSPAPSSAVAIGPQAPPVAGPTHAGGPSKAGEPVPSAAVTPAPLGNGRRSRLRSPGAPGGRE